MKDGYILEASDLNADVHPGEVSRKFRYAFQEAHPDCPEEIIAGIEAGVRRFICLIHEHQINEDEIIIDVVYDMTEKSDVYREAYSIGEMFAAWLWMNADEDNRRIGTRDVLMEDKSAAEMLNVFMEGYVCAELCPDGFHAGAKQMADSMIKEVICEYRRKEHAEQDNQGEHTHQREAEHAD